MQKIGKYCRKAGIEINIYMLRCCCYRFWFEIVKLK